MYEDAPATKMVATECACCARPLVDAESVEAGIGPECRRRHGYGKASGTPDFDAAAAALGDSDGALEITAAVLGLASRYGDPDNYDPGAHAHAWANVLVHRIAVEQDGASVTAYTNALRALGYAKLADRIAERLATVKIDLDEQGYVVRTPYSADAVDAFRRVPGRRWDREVKANRFPVQSKVALFVVLCRLYPGATAKGPKGLFTLAA